MMKPLSWKTKIFFTTWAFVLTHCADKKVKLWIDPPPQDSDFTQSQNIQYRVKDAGSGKDEKLVIPVKRIPEMISVRVDDHTLEHSSQDTVTEVDQALFHTGKKIDRKREDSKPPSLSYVKGIQEIDQLYKKKDFSTALIKTHRLIRQYPKQADLYLKQGTLLQKMGQKKPALASYQQAKELDPQNLSIDEVILKLESELGESAISHSEKK